MNDKSTRLGTMPMGRLLVSMSVPMMLSFFIQAMYNIVDSMFVAQISEDALAAVSLAFPVQQLIVALCTGTGVAVNALVPRYLGMGDKARATRIANNAVFLSGCFTVLFLLIGLFGVGPFYRMQTDKATVVEAGIQYLSIVCMLGVGACFCMVLEKLLIAGGSAMLSMASQATGAVFNLIFDPLLIFGIGPFPAMGVRGAAVATVLGQILSAITALVMLVLKEKQVRLSLPAMRPDGRQLKEIATVAVPSAVTIGLGSLMNFGMNQILLGFSTTAAAVFGIWMKLQNFACMPIFGLNNGAVPILAFNFGSGRLNRVRECHRLAMRIAIGLMVILTCLFLCIPRVLLTLFNAS